MQICTRSQRQTPNPLKECPVTGTLHPLSATQECTRRKSGAATLLILLFGSWISPSYGGFVLNNTNGPPFTTAHGDGFLDILVAEAFKRAGATVRFVTLPPERGLRNANEGIEDGEVTRIAGIELNYRNLLPVPEKVIDWKFSIFSRSPNLDIQSDWHALARYSVGIIKGWKIAEKNLHGKLDVVYAGDVSQLFRLLEKERAEVIVYSREMGLAYLQAEGLHGIYLLEPPLESREMFIYLHSKHAAFVPKLAESLRSLKADGTYERMYRESITQKLQSGP